MRDDRTDRSGVDLAEGDHGPAADATDEVATHGHVDDDGAAAGVDAAGGRWRRRALRWLPWFIVVLAVAVAVTSTWRWQELASVERDREDVAAASSRFVTTLTTWDASDGMTATRDELRAAGTETFGRQVDELFGTTEDLRGLADLGASSEGDVRQVFVQSLSGDRAEALAVVLQRTTTDTVEVPEVHLRYASLELQRVDGEWLVEELELLLDTAPGAGAAGPGTETVAPGELDEDQQEGEG